ncbi:MAG: MFS transporter, partial [Ignavibacteria bacterium]|nr:MFS transporter [Ignavibacteria bacterium]
MNKVRLGFWQVWNMSFGFLGIQFGFALQNANVSRIFETLGASIDEIPILWIAAPTTGLLVQPIIGYLSDRTWGRLGRRRPYFLVGAILASAALIVMPNSPALWVAAGMLWILDASINISMEPFRALVADLLPSEQRTTGFAVQSFFIGTGAIIASALPYIFTNWLGISNTAEPGHIPDSVLYSFYIGAFAFLGAVSWTVFRTKEYPPKDMAEFNRLKEENKGFLKGISEIFNSFVGMPKTMIQLAFVQFFSWFALFAMWIYTTPAVTHHIYGATDPSSELYNKGANWVGVLFSIYNGFAALTAFLLPWIA